MAGQNAAGTHTHTQRERERERERGRERDTHSERAGDAVLWLHIHDDVVLRLCYDSTFKFACLQVQRSISNSVKNQPETFIRLFRSGPAPFSCVCACLRVCVLWVQQGNMGTQELCICMLYPQKHKRMHVNIDITLAIHFLPLPATPLRHFLPQRKPYCAL